jgi:8-oxo-dGTP diphosphatase
MAAPDRLSLTTTWLTRKEALMDSVDLRCSAIVFRDDTVLLVHRRRNGTDDWVLPGGTPRPGESMAACARRETLEETGLSVDPARVAFILEALGPGSTRRAVDLVFLAAADGPGEPGPREPDLEARFVPLSLLPGLDVRPPLAGHLRALHARGGEPTAAYLGNLWRPQRQVGD